MARSERHCGMCGGVLIFLGQLGLIRHYRCRQCGMVISRRIKAERGA